MKARKEENKEKIQNSVQKKRQHGNLEFHSHIF